MSTDESISLGAEQAIEPADEVAPAELVAPSSTPKPPFRPQRPTRAIPPTPAENSADRTPAEADSLGKGKSTEQAEDTTDPAELTAIRAHYLKKSLIQLQFRHEVNAITSSYPNNISTLSFLGPPFAPPPKDVQPYLDLPFLKYAFRQFVLTFPFMAAAPKDFYSDKLQPFVLSALSRNLSPASVLEDGVKEDIRTASRKKILVKVERNLSMFLSSATKLVEREELVRLTQADLERLETMAAKKPSRHPKDKIVFEVNIVGVRTVVDKGRVRSRAHEEFIIRTSRSNYPDTFVSRRYGDFKTLATELAKAHPHEQVRPPPAKDKSSVVAATMSPTSSTWETEPYSPEYDQSGYGYQQPIAETARLAREKNRLTLRAYLNGILSSSTLASSPVIKSFLTAGQFQLTPMEMEDVRRREEADSMRDEGRKKFAKEIASRVEGLREAVKSVKGDLMGKDGLTHIFAIVKVTPNIRDLPSNYKAVLEWARISMASTVFHQFVASDKSSENFASLKRIHGLMPYFMLKTVLKISNPVAMIRGILDLFLAQPFGGRSLLQRMFTSSLTEEVKILEAQLEAVKEKIDDPIMCTKIKQFIYAPREIQDMYKADAAADGINLLIHVLRAPDEPYLSRPQMQRLSRAHFAHVAYTRHREQLADSDDDDGPQNEDAWLVEDLKVLTHLYSKLRDREQIIELIFEGSTADLLKDIITIFYSPLAQVYRAASIADSLGDLQNFINDLIKTVEQVEERAIVSQEDPRQTVQAFIDLVQRHEQSFYYFVHKVHSKGENLFDGLMRWIELFLTVVREGIGSAISLEFLLPHTGKERDEIMAEVDKVARHHYALKVAYEAKIRKRFKRMQQNPDEADAEDEATQVLVDGVVGEMDFGELVHGDANELAAEDTDSSEDEESDSDAYDTASDDSESDSDATSSENHPRMAASQPSSRSRTPARIAPQKSMSHLTSPMSSSRLEQDLPPLPPVPQSGDNTTNKPLPRSPTTTTPQGLHPGSIQKSASASIRSPGPAPPPSIRTTALSEQGHGAAMNGTSAGKPAPRSKKKGVQAPKAPELEHIPKLLPVFIEMMRPSLRPRQV